MTPRRLLPILPTILPAGLWLLTIALGSNDESSRRVFHADLVAMVTVGIGACFLGCGVRSCAQSLGIAMAVVVLSRLPLASTGSAFAWTIMTAVVSCVALGLSRIGHTLGLDRFRAGLAPALVITLACTSIAAADPIGDAADVTLRFPIKQALINVDPTTVCAYAASGHDRLHDPTVYDHVPLASSLIQPPTLGSFVWAWGPCALVLLLVSIVCRPSHRGSPS